MNIFEHFTSFGVSMLALLASIVPQPVALAYVAPELAPPPGASIVFGGDVMLDRSIRKVINARGGDYIFSCIDPILHDADVAVVNLEGPVTDHESVSLNSHPGDDYNFTFTFATTTAPLLFAHNIRLVSLGNNHISNFGNEGVAQTKQWLTASGVGFFGASEVSASDAVARASVNGIAFSFVNWSDWSGDTSEHVISQVEGEASRGRVVVVYTHWGDEYVPPPERVRELAHAFVDAGAAIVIGSHPHIVQEHERYHGKDIYYSLGNLVFDQYWYDDVRHGLMLKVDFSPYGVRSVKEIPVELLRDGRTCAQPDVGV